MKKTILALAVAGLMATVTYQHAQAAVGNAKTVGRVRVTTLHASPSEAVRAALSARLAPAAGKRFVDRRLISVRPRPDDDKHFDATIYDYTVEKGFDLVVDSKGNELSRKPLTEQPARSADELADAYTVVRESEAFGAALKSGSLMVYEPMPPITVDAEGRRLVNVGIASNVSEGHLVQKNEVVSVHIGTGTVVRYTDNAPETSRASLLACGPSSSGCSASTGTCSYYQISWPTVDPVWQLKIRHPSCTNDVQGDGTGLEITDVFYRGRLVLKRGEVPVLNVLYENNTCGPYRDWLDSEDCFQAVGTDAAPGVRVTTQPPSTLCESGTPGSDAGNFRGVAIYDQGNALWLMTETTAGWYRYVMEWRLYMDGTIEPIFGFGATLNSCTCNPHYHHAYWRLEWAIDGTLADPNSGISTIEHLRPGSSDDYDPVTTEATFVRPAVDPDKDYFRIRNPITGNGYILHPGQFDGTASGDTYGKWDLAALNNNNGEINDSNSNTSVNVAPWVSGETLGTSKRLVTWYHATYDHDDPGGTGEPCELAGPKFVPLVPCAGWVSIDRNVYSCSSAVTITVNDSDLSGTGTLHVGVTSSAETAPETVTLTENPAGTGRFVGTVNTFAGPAVTGDGKVSVVDGDSLNVQYVDASACGTPNVPLNKTASVDCSVPAISNIHAAPGAGTTTITWDTTESATGIVHFGSTVPPVSSVSAAGTTSHSATLTGLSDCATYYFWVESADAAGNIAASNNGGGYYAFTTPQPVNASYPSVGAPIPIPDANSTGVTSTIAVGSTGIVQDVNVTVNVTHTYDNDLTLSLITPGGVTIPLSNRRGGSSNNFTNTVFDDEATTPISSGAAPFTGSFRPESPLSVADNLSATGNWKFKVVDQIAQDTGTIDNWTLSITYPPGVCPPASTPPVPDGSFGVGMTASRASGLGEGIQLAWDTATCAARNYHLLYGDLSRVSAYELTGGVCGLGPVGSYSWNNTPAGDLWFIVVADDAGSLEGSWGNDGAGAPRNGSIASSQCGFTSRSNAGTCP
jgi:subtilisin-like proprotein convertase family protein